MFRLHGCLLLIVMAVSAETVVAADTEALRLAAEHFETAVRPLLIERCVQCHGGSKQEAGLRLDTRQGLVSGGETGPAFDSINPADSLILHVVGYKGDVQMPPDGQLSAREISALDAWIKGGAPWPESTGKLVSPDELAARAHWAFQPVAASAIPAATADDSWVRTPVDAFILEQLRENGLVPSPVADRRTLIRRVSQTLTGLPPTPAEVTEFMRSDDPHAYEELVNRLLDSPHYGEHWARHWLDVARYSDTKGYVYAREERFWVHAWAYRDWVVRAFNENLPYDRFLLLQVAADQVSDRRPDDVAAMGFLTLGRRFLGVSHDIIDDRIDVVCRGTMGLTVGCARCHDHKYDPIPTADYYSLYGIFDSCVERVVPLGTGSQGSAEFQQGLRERQEKLAQKRRDSRAEVAERVRGRIGDYLVAQTELEKYPPAGFDQVFEKTDVLPAFVRRWDRYLQEARRRQDPIFVPWHRFAAIPPAEFEALAPQVAAELQNELSATVHPLVAQAFVTPPKTFREVVDRYAELFVAIHTEWQALVKQTAEVAGAAPPEGLADPAAEQLRRVLYGSDAPCEVPDEPIVHTETFFDLATCTELWKLQGEVDRWIIGSAEPVAHALTLADRATPLDAFILKRGNSKNLGDLVPRQFLSLIAGEQRQPFQQGSGRLELAQAIIAPTNPLTARVMVNRVWAQHFDQGLVPTTSDFGLRADRPSHPELLDWLTTRFIASGWNIKELQRLLLLSATFQQSSAASGIGTEGEREIHQRAVELDPGNRLLWKMNARRQTFEEFRDASLQAAGELDLALGGKPVNLFQAPFPRRRTLYGLVDRQFLPSTLRVFDFANPDLHIPQRSETTVPQQALFFLNHPLMLDRCRAVAATIDPAGSAEANVAQLFQQLLQRSPTADELRDAQDLVSSATATPRLTPPPTAADWSYGFGAYDEPTARVASFTALPHFTGQAWQGGPNWPDATLGWVQLTAEGGHPGNDRHHAAVRRWTAPRSMSLQISTKLDHEPNVGDGIRAFIISSRAGPLTSLSILHDSQELNVPSVEVVAGETIDFLVDIGGGLNSDQYLWQAKLTEVNSSAPPTAWDSRSDFSPVPTPPRLNGWEQLVQILLCTNEFLFVD